MMIDRFHACVFPQIDDQAPAAGLQHAAHLLQRANRLAEVLECRAAKQEVEGVVGEWHAGSVALAELDAHACVRGFLAGDFDKRVADVEACGGVISKLRQLDAKVAGARRNFEHRAAPGKLAGDSTG
jgi:hypothetical protein